MKLLCCWARDGPLNLTVALECSVTIVFVLRPTISQCYKLLEGCYLLQIQKNIQHFITIVIDYWCF